MARPRLNPRQKAWLSRFLASHPEYKLREAWSGLDGERHLLLEGFERLPMPAVAEFADAFAGYRWHTLWLQLRKFGDPRKTATHTYTTVYPHCNLNQKLTAVIPDGQLSLPIPAAVLAVPEPVNPVVVTRMPKHKTRPKHSVQLTLPVIGLEAELFALRQLKQSPKPPVSSQELLAEKTATWDCRNNTEVELLQVVIELLLAQGANDEEWHSALDLYQMIGLSGVMRYVEGLPTLRKYFGTAGAAVTATATTIPAHTKAKTTTVPVQALD